MKRAMHRMKWLICLSIVAVLSACSAAPPPKPRSDQAVVNSLVGGWKGILDVGFAQFTIVLDIDQKEILSATLACPEQMITDFPVDNIVFEQGRLKLEILPLGATYEGALMEQEILGTLSQSGFSFPLVFKKTEKVAKN